MDSVFIATWIAVTTASSCSMARGGISSHATTILAVKFRPNDRISWYSEVVSDFATVHWLVQGLGGAIDELLAGPDGELRLSAVKAVGSLDEAWRDVVWRPGDEAAPCCGLQCETCEEVTPEKFWCGGNIDVRCSHYFKLSRVCVCVCVCVCVSSQRNSKGPAGPCAGTFN